MHEIPEPMDMEKIMRACDQVMRYVRSHYVDEHTLESLTLLCAFVNRIKAQVEYLDEQVHYFRLLSDFQARKMAEDADEEKQVG